MKELDVRPIVPREKHSTIFKLLDELDKGETLRITNDHDPKPLYYQLEAERKGEFNWEYLEDGPDVWKVNIQKNKIVNSAMPDTIQKPGVLENIPKEKIVDLDVREDIKNGKDPIYKIKPTVELLKEGEVLHLINTFEPVPLYTVLGKKGFSHWTEKIDKIFHVYFFKDPTQIISDKKVIPVGETASEKRNDDSDGVDIIEIDVRELTPPEPMVKILSILPELKDTSVLLVHHHREPMMLYEKLEERGFTAVCHKINDNYFKVVITKKSN